MKKCSPLLFSIIGVVFSILVFLGCKKNLTNDFLENSESYSAIKSQFDNSGYGNKLITSINDSFSLKELPQWNRFTTLVKENRTYYYVPISRQVESKKRQNHFPGFTVGEELFLIIVRDGDKTRFIRASYYFDNRKSHSISQFTGRLLLRDLQTDKRTYATFANGVDIKKASVQNEIKSFKEVKPLGLVCETFFDCEYYSTCPQNWVFAHTLVSSSSPNFPGGCKCPTQIFQTCAPPTGGTCYGGQWFLFSSQTYEHCYDDDPPPPPPPPPVNPSYPYARIEITNDNQTNWYEGDVYREENTIDVYMRFYTDASCTTPTTISAFTLINYVANEGYINSMGPGNGPATIDYIVQSPSSPTSQIYLGNLVRRTYQAYPDPYYGQVTDETYKMWETSPGTGYNTVSTYWY